MNQVKRLVDWLETHWATPAYSGWLLSGLSVFFFLSATNTLAGWLYVISGIGAALLVIAAVLPERNLHRLRVQRHSIEPVSAGDALTIELLLENPTPQSRDLIQVQDILPDALGRPVSHSIETIAPRSTYRWSYTHPTQRRGVYRWQLVHLRTAAPLGLFWCRRSRSAKARAIVYPTVLPLSQCPLIDEMGQDDSVQIRSDRRAQTATEGLTRSLRPYRWGDSTRLIHWRTSARYGELRVRELETFTGGQELVIGLDSTAVWQPEDFEQAVIAAASLYFYAYRHNLSAKLWTAGTGLIQGNQAVLEVLAAIVAAETSRTEFPSAPTIWLTQNLDSLDALPHKSRWLLWARSGEARPTAPLKTSGILIEPERSLQVQLQRSLSNSR